jgi:dienelactone hydrolase
VETAAGIAILTEPYSADRMADVLLPLEPVAAPGVLLWHGRGTHERQVMRRLAVELAAAGVVVVVPDYSPLSAEGGRPALLASVDWFVEQGEGHGIDPERMVLAGWSYGAAAAAGFVFENPGQPFRKLVGLAGSYDRRTPTAADTPLRLAKRGPEVSVALIHGRHDTIDPAAGSEELCSVLTDAGVPADLVIVDTDHAGAILTRFDPVLGICVPTPQVEPAGAEVVDAILRVALA